ncbi:MAG: DUF2139 domain-containing protein [Desulfurococcaceae archaeon]
MCGLYIYNPRYGPEWGSGGIFGLTYYRGVLYYTLAMEARSFFIHDDGYVHEYKYQHLGPGPASGGDTYGAVDAVDNEIFFGGWVHNPAVHKGRVGKGGEIDFRNKYSHVHVYNVEERSVKLLWSDSIHHEYEWAGEVSQIVYDPVNDRLLLARADGHRNLGIYELPRKGGKAERLSEVPALKGSLFLDYACFDMQPHWFKGIDGVQCIDLVERSRVTKYTAESWSNISVDEYGVEYRWSGYAVSSYSRYYHFFRGGFIVGNPVEPEYEELAFVRLFDFGPVQYSPQRSGVLPVGGGILAAFSSMVHGVVHPRNPFEEQASKYAKTVAGPSVLVYITPPLARIVHVAGARITSLAYRNGEILLGYNTDPNLGGADATPVDTGRRYIGVVRESELLSSRSPEALFRVYGWAVGSSAFGGIPLSGYREPLLVLKASKSNKLTVSHYDAGLPPKLIEKNTYLVNEGFNRIELSGYWGIVSFKLESEDNDMLSYVVLR